MGAGWSLAGLSGAGLIAGQGGLPAGGPGEGAGGLSHQPAQAPVLGDPPPPPLPKEAWSARCLSVQTPCPAAPVQDSGLRVSEALSLMVPLEAAAGRPPHPSLSAFSPSLITLPCPPPRAGHKRRDLPSLPVSLFLSVSLCLSPPVSLPLPPSLSPYLSLSPLLSLSLPACFSCWNASRALTVCVCLNPRGTTRRPPGSQQRLQEGGGEAGPARGAAQRWAGAPVRATSPLSRPRTPKSPCSRGQARSARPTTGQ